MARNIRMVEEEDDDVIDTEDMVEYHEDGSEDVPEDVDPHDEMEDEREQDGEEASEEASAGPPLRDDSVHVFTGHTDSVYAVAFSPSPSNRVASGGGDEVAFLWTVNEESDPLELRGHSDSVCSLAFSSDGAFLATGGLDGLVQVWDASNGRLKHKLDGPGGAIEWVRWHPRGHVVLAGSEDMSVWMWNAESGVYMGVFTGHSAEVSAGMFTPDGKMVVTGSADASIRIWDPKTTATLHTLAGYTAHSAAVTCLDTRGEGGVGISGSEDKTALVFSWQFGKAVGKLIGHQDSVECVALHASLPIVATGSPDKHLLLWDLNTMQNRGSCKHEDGIVQMAWHPSNPALLASACADGSVHLWDGRVGSSVKTFLGHSEAVLGMSLSGDGEFILTGSDDNSCRVYSLSE